MLKVVPELSSINAFTSALLILSNLPVTRKDLSFNKPFLLSVLAFFIFNNLSSSFKTFKLAKTEKKCLTELICVSPIPSIFIKSSKLLFFESAIKFFSDFKFLEIILAFSKHICLMPKA